MRLLTTKEVMEHLSISRTLLWRLVQQKKITPVFIDGDGSRHPRFREEDVEALCRPAEVKK